MKKYIKTKIIEAKPMTIGELNIVEGKFQKIQQMRDTI